MREEADQKTIGLALGDILPEAMLAARWGKTVRTLQRMRTSGCGPHWFAIGRSAFYRVSDILAFEEASIRKQVQ